ncbi:MAG: indole-3-glycerol phosphate synthase TrpC, partial [SAR202 cluster bacterium]|nr:indole-3-glycerol phosphate synthase TrpC [SAR202 cluster bacterium]
VHDTVHPLGVPVLRKEFIYDPYQVYEARANGADAILLIVAMLSPDQLSELRDLAEKFWMQTLVEVHDESELDGALELGAEIIGINNRNLHTFVTDVSVTERLAGKVSSGKIVVSESGINSAEDIAKVRAAGAHAALIGESLVASENIGQKLRSLV